MEEILKKIPNWARYILAIPGALVFTIAVYLLNLLCIGYASPDSLIVQLLPWTFGSFVKIIAFCYGFVCILPKYQFELTIAASGLYIGFYFFVMLFLKATNNLNLGSIISFLLMITACIIGCYVSYSKYGIYRIKKKESVDLEEYNIRQ